MKTFHSKITSSIIVTTQFIVGSQQMYQYFHSHDPVFHGSPPSLLSVVSINSYFDVICVMNKNPTMASKDDISDNITGARFNEDSKHYLISKFDFPEIIIISGISVDVTHKISTNYRPPLPPIYS